MAPPSKRPQLGDLVNALVGENLALWATRREVVGVVIDGAVRDIDVPREMELPIYAAGVTFLLERRIDLAATLFWLSGRVGRCRVWRGIRTWRAAVLPG